MNQDELAHTAEAAKEQFEKNLKKQNRTDMIGHNIYTIQKVDREGNLIDTKFAMNYLTDYGMYHALFLYNVSGVIAYLANIDNHDPRDPSIIIGGSNQQSSDYIPIKDSVPLSGHYSPKASTNPSNSSIKVETINGEEMLVGSSKRLQFTWDYSYYDRTTQMPIETCGFNHIAIGYSSNLLFYASLYDDNGRPMDVYTKGDGEKLIVTIWMSAVMKTKIITDLLVKKQYLVTSPIYWVSKLAHEDDSGRISNIIQSFSSENGSSVGRSDGDISYNCKTLSFGNTSTGDDDMRNYNFPVYIGSAQNFHDAKNMLELIHEQSPSTEPLPTIDNIDVEYDNPNPNSTEKVTPNPSTVSGSKRWRNVRQLEPENADEFDRPITGTLHVADFYYPFRMSPFVMETSIVNRQKTNGFTNYLSTETFFSDYRTSKNGSLATNQAKAYSEFLLSHQIKLDNAETIKIGYCFTDNLSTGSFSKLFGNYSCDIMNGTSTSTAEYDYTYMTNCGRVPVMDLEMTDGFANDGDGTNNAIMSYNYQTHAWDIPLPFQKHPTVEFHTKSYFSACMWLYDPSIDQNRHINVWPNLCRDINGIKDVSNPYATKLYMAEKYWDFTTYVEVNRDGTIPAACRKYPWIVNVGYSMNFYNNATRSYVTFHENDYDENENLIEPKLLNAEITTLTTTQESIQLFEQALKVLDKFSYNKSNPQYQTDRGICITTIGVEQDPNYSYNYQSDGYMLNPIYMGLYGDDSCYWGNEPKAPWFICFRYLFFTKEDANGKLVLDVTNSQQLKKYDDDQQAFVDFNPSYIRYQHKARYAVFEDANVGALHVYNIQKRIGEGYNYTFTKDVNYWKLDLVLKPDDFTSISSNNRLYFNDFQSGKWVVFNRQNTDADHFSVWIINIGESGDGNTEPAPYFYQLREQIKEEPGEGETEDDIWQAVQTKMCAPILNTNYCCYQKYGATDPTFVLYDMAEANESDRVKYEFVLDRNQYDISYDEACYITGFDDHIYIQMRKSTNTSSRILYHISIDSGMITVILDDNGENVTLYRDHLSLYDSGYKCSKTSEQHCYENAVWNFGRFHQPRLIDLPDGDKIFIFGHGYPTNDTTTSSGMKYRGVVPYISSDNPTYVSYYDTSHGLKSVSAELGSSCYHQFDVKYIMDGKKLIMYDKNIMDIYTSTSTSENYTTPNAYAQASGIKTLSLFKYFDLGACLDNVMESGYYPYYFNSPIFDRSIKNTTIENNAIWSFTNTHDGSTYTWDDRPIFRSQILLGDQVFAIATVLKWENNGNKTRIKSDECELRVKTFDIITKLPFQITGKTKTPTCINNPVKVSPSDLNIIFKNTD